MAAVSTMILRSMRLIGAKERGATLDANEQTETLAELNTFMDACANERLLCYQIQQDSLALTASTSTYTIGTNGAFAVTRPTKLVDPCFIRDANGYDTPVEIIDAATYGRIVSKASGYTVPTRIFYDGAYSATSTGTLFLAPSPSGSLTLFINSWKQLGTFANLSTTVLLPPGYQLFIESNFAVHLATGLTPISAELAKMARDSKAAIKALNAYSPVMGIDSGALQSYRMRGNIFTG